MAAQAKPSEVREMPRGGATIVIRALQKISNEVVKPRGDSNFFTAAFARADPQDKIVLDTCSAAIKVCAFASH